MSKCGKSKKKAHKLSPKVARARGSINSQKAKQLVLYLWILSAVSKKKIMGAKKAEEKML